MIDEHEEVPATLESLREQLKTLGERQNAHYTEIMLKLQEIHDAADASIADQVSGLYDEAVKIVREPGEASTSYLQRVLGIGYVVAAKLIDELEARRVIGRADGSRPREVLPFDDAA
jgi:S-DNA-T family DNA segregation ATPase FtsK/SpoIIIE